MLQTDKYCDKMHRSPKNQSDCDVFLYHSNLRQSLNSAHVTSPLLANDFFTPRIKLLCRKCSGFHPGKPVVIPAVIFEYVITFLAERPPGDGANFLAGAAPAAGRPQCSVMTRPVTAKYLPLLYTPASFPPDRCTRGDGGQ